MSDQAGTSPYAAGPRQNLVLRCEQGPQAGRQVPVQATRFSIGRNSDNALVLSETAVSRHHACLEVREGRWVVQDLGSSNGSFLNRQQLQPHVPVPLNDGDFLALGDSLFTVILQTVQPPVSRGAGQRPPPGKKRSPLAVVLVAAFLIIVVAAAVWALTGEQGQKKETSGGLALPTVVLPEINIRTLQLPTGLPSIAIPTIYLSKPLPVATPAPDLINPIQTALPGLKLPKELPKP
jgi:hypothetical protein